MKNRKKLENECYYNAKEKIAIGYDNLQWIMVYKSTYTFYPTFTMLLERLGEHKVREYTNTDIKSLYEAIQHVYSLCESIGKNIKLPKELYG